MRGLLAAVGGLSGPSGVPRLLGVGSFGTLDSGAMAFNSVLGTVPRSILKKDPRVMGAQM